MAEPEIHARLLEALEPFDLKEIEPPKAAAQADLETFSSAMFEAYTANRTGAISAICGLSDLGPGTSSRF